MKYVSPFPLLPIQMAKQGGGTVSQPGFIMPAAYLKKFHPKYASADELAKAAAAKKVQTPADLWGKAGDLEGPVPFWFANPDLPVIFAWKMATPPPRRAIHRGAESLLLASRYGGESAALYRQDRVQPLR